MSYNLLERDDELGIYYTLFQLIYCISSEVTPFAT